MLKDKKTKSFNFNKNQDNYLREVQIKRTKSKKLLKEIFVNLISLYVLYMACYSNRDENTYNYVQEIKTIFRGYEKVFFIFNTILIKMISSFVFFLNI